MAVQQRESRTVKYSVTNSSATSSACYMNAEQRNDDALADITIIGTASKPNVPGETGNKLRLTKMQVSMLNEITCAMLKGWV